MRILEFEFSLAEIEHRISELENLSSNGSDKDSDEEKSFINKALIRQKEKHSAQLHKLYQKTTPWQKVQIARHEERPHTKNFISGLIDDFQLFRGDRSFGEDSAIITGIGRLGSQSVIVIGQERGSSTKTRIEHHFGMPYPEGYRKASRIIKLAERFNIPILTFIDTPGADPGIESEQRGQSQAIANCLHSCLIAKVPIIVTIIGEGGSGGAVAIAVGDYIQILSNAVYTVISPEGCSAILWKNADHSVLAADMLRITAQDLKQLKLIDSIIEEPVGGAHRHKDVVIKAVGKEISLQLKQLKSIDAKTLVEKRHKKFLDMGKIGL